MCHVVDVSWLWWTDLYILVLNLSVDICIHIFIITGTTPYNYGDFLSLFTEISLLRYLY